MVKNRLGDKRHLISIFSQYVFKTIVAELKKPLNAFLKKILCLSVAGPGGTTQL